VLRKVNPDMYAIIMQDMYGKILAEPRHVSLLETELVAVGALYPLRVPEQLKSHLRGAIHLGATGVQMTGLLNLAKFICRHA